MADGYFIKRETVEQVETLEGIHRRTMGTTDEAMLCQFTLEAGSIVPRHNHMNDQVGYIVSGEIEITIGDETRNLKAGDSYAIPGGIYHSAKVLQDTQTIDVFSPPREDYRTEAK